MLTEGTVVFNRKTDFTSQLHQKTSHILKGFVIITRQI